MNTAWKVSVFGDLFWSSFSRIPTRIAPNKDTFYAMKSMNQAIFRYFQNFQALFPNSCYIRSPQNHEPMTELKCFLNTKRSIHGCVSSLKIICFKCRKINTTASFWFCIWHYFIKALFDSFINLPIKESHGERVRISENHLRELFR